MRMAISPKRPTPTTKTITIKGTTITKTTRNSSSSNTAGSIRNINSNSHLEGDTMMNRECWLSMLVDAANARQRLLQCRC
jgi:hypothetical protein